MDPVLNATLWPNRDQQKLVETLTQLYYFSFHSNEVQLKESTETHKANSPFFSTPLKARSKELPKLVGNISLIGEGYVSDVTWE